jgi:hypothetical protein
MSYDANSSAVSPLGLGPYSAMTTGSVKEEDISMLEGRIRDRILGQKAAGRRYKGPVFDEWAGAYTRPLFSST